MQSATLVTRRVAPPLDACIDHLWHCVRPALPHAREWGLPSVAGDIVVPLSDDALVRYDSIDDAVGRRYAGGVLQGAHERPFLRDTSHASVVVGVHLRPGGLAAFIASPAEDFTDRAVALAEVWGNFASELRERLLVVGCDAERRLALLEALLRRRVLKRRHAGLEADPLVAWAIASLAASNAAVGAVQRASGLSAPSFIGRFRAGSGLAPKRYCELLRFRSAVQLGHARSAGWADVAAAAGYADQAHLSREFRRFAGFTPSRYRSDATAFAMHVAAAR